MIHKNLHNICLECGKELFGRITGVATWHYANCDRCNKFKAVTETRDFTEPLNKDFTNKEKTK